MIGPLLISAKPGASGSHRGACRGRRVTAERGALHFHESSIFAFLFFRHRPLLPLRGLGHARLGPVSVRKPPWFPDECRALRRAAAGAENASFAASFSTGPEAKVLLASRRSWVRIPSAALRKACICRPF